LNLYARGSRGTYNFFCCNLQPCQKASDRPSAGSGCDNQPDVNMSATKAYYEVADGIRGRRAGRGVQYRAKNISL